MAGNPFADPAERERGRVFLHRAAPAVPAAVGSLPPGTLAVAGAANELRNTEPSTLSGWLSAMFPTAAANARSADKAMAEAYAQDNMGRTLGAATRKTVMVPVGAVWDMFSGETPAERSIGEGTISFLAGLTGLGDGSGGKMPPAKAAAAKGKAAPNAATQTTLAAAPAGANLAASPMAQSPLMQILGNLAQENPKGGLTLGDLRKLGSVFPGTPPTGSGRTPSARDVMAYQAAALDDYLFNQADAVARQKMNEAEYAQFLAEANERRKAFRAQLATNTKLDEGELAEILAAEAK